MPDDKTIDKDLELLANAAKQAGELALRYFNKDPQIWTKGNDSPVTEADLAVDKMLHQMLLQARPDYGWLSEETEDNPDRLNTDKQFVVDPIDGTRGFIEGKEEWTVSVAITQDGKPVAAALYAPVRDELFLAGLGKGATMNGTAIHCNSDKGWNNARTTGPAAAVKRGPLAQRGVKSTKYISSLAYRMVMPATDTLDIGLARSGAHDWDLAAADLILKEAGGLILDNDEKELVYNKPVPRHGSLVGAHRNLALKTAPLLNAMDFPKRKD